MWQLIGHLTLRNAIPGAGAWTGGPHLNVVRQVVSLPALELLMPSAGFIHDTLVHAG